MFEKLKEIIRDKNRSSRVIKRGRDFFVDWKMLEEEMIVRYGEIRRNSMQ